MSDEDEADPEPEDCHMCQGTGEGRTEYMSCASCRGRGWLLPINEDEE